MENKRIYAIVAGTIQVPANYHVHNGKKIVTYDGKLKTVVQPIGRQAAQSCHVVSKLRIINRMWHDSDSDGKPLFEPITTIVLQARDSNEMCHLHRLLLKKKLNPVIFSDENEKAYGPGKWPTAIAVLATKKQVDGILDYLPLWGSQ